MFILNFFMSEDILTISRQSDTNTPVAQLV